MEIKPIVYVDENISIGLETIDNMVARILACENPVFALAIAKMMEKAAKDVIAQSKQPVIDFVADQIVDSDGNSIEVGDSVFTYRKGSTSHIFTDLEDWEKARQAVQDAKFTADQYCDELLNNEYYQLLRFKESQAQKLLTSLEERLVATGKSTITHGADSVSVSFKKS